jgi:hypothetical protein
MDSVKFFCPACRQKLEAESDMFGTKLQCPVCNAWMQVPGGTDQAVPEPVPAKSSKPRYMLALGVGAALGVVLLAGGLALAWLLGVIGRGESSIDMSALPEWSPQAASSSLQSVSVPGVIKEEPSARPEEPRTPVQVRPPAPAASSGRAEVRPDDVARLRQPPTEERPKEVEEPPPRPPRVLSDDEKRKVFAELLACDDKAQAEARRLVPEDATQGMEVGASLKLRERTPLYRGPPPVDSPQAEVEEAGKLQAGMTILVLESRPGRSSPWYRVDVTDKSGAPAGKGWVSAASLTGQAREDMEARHVKQQRVQADLLSQYQRAVEKDHGITTAQARKILSEGIENQWDGSKRGDVTGE